MKNPEKVKQGKRNKAMGADFERRTRKDLEEKGWKVSKYSNNVSFDYDADKFYNSPKGTTGLCIPAKPGRFRMMQTGFPDFIAYKLISNTMSGVYEVQFIECKTNGYLSKEEKAKAKWYLDNDYCSKFLIAYKTKVKNRVVVNYKEFK